MAQGEAPADKPVEATDSSRGFLLHEYDALRTEVLALIEHSRKLEVLVAGGLAAYYAWYLSVPGREHAILFVPPLVVLLAGLRAWGTLVRLEEIGRYVQGVELEFKTKGTAARVFGWENYRLLPENQSAPFVSTGSMLWFALLALSVLAIFVLK